MMAPNHHVRANLCLKMPGPVASVRAFITIIPQIIDDSIAENGRKVCF
jgi:hypothetical protein